jgi:hypothetical protein
MLYAAVTIVETALDHPFVFDMSLVGTNHSILIGVIQENDGINQKIESFFLFHEVRFEREKNGSHVKSSQ